MRTSSRFFLILAAVSVASAAHADAGGADPRTTTTVTAEGDSISKVSAKFRDSIFLFDQSVTPDTLNNGAQLSAIPSYQWWLSLRPRYYITPKLSLRLRADLTVEWLNAADTTHLREGQFGDIWIDTVYQLPMFWGIQPTVGGRVLLPTSLESQGGNTVMKVGPTIGFTRAFEGTKIGDLELRLGIYGLYNFVTHTTGGVNVNYGCTTTEWTPAVCGQNTGVWGSQFTLVAAISGKYVPKWAPKLSIGISYIVSDSFVYATPAGQTINDRTGGVTQVPRSPLDQKFRQSEWFLASIDYDVKDYVSLSLGYYCLRPVLDPDGKYGNPFYSPGGNARIFFTTTFTLDKVYEAVARRMKKKNTTALVTDPIKRISF